MLARASDSEGPSAAPETAQQRSAQRVGVVKSGVATGRSWGATGGWARLAYLSPSTSRRWLVRYVPLA